MELKKISDIKSFKGKRVLLRTDFNVPMRSGKIIDDTRIKAALPTINFLIRKKAAIIIISHLGRPSGKVKNNLRLDPVAVKLSKLLGIKVKKINKIEGPEVNFLAQQLAVGQILMLENIRFHPREEKNCQRFAKKLAGLADYYVNDAFSVSHREEASVSAITNYLPSYAGLNLAKEEKVLSNLLKNPKKPFAVVIGGIKISTKIKVIKKFLEVADNILLGGALANTVLKAKNIAVGHSIVEPKIVKQLKKIDLTNNKLHIPVDTVTAKKISAKAKVYVKAAGNIEPDELILDIGPDTADLFVNIVKKSKTVIWSGPMGAFEYPRFSQGTKKVVDSILKLRADIVIGGGDTIAALNKFASKEVLRRKNIYISTGGGAMLKFLETGDFTSLKKLKK